MAAAVETAAFPHRHTEGSLHFALLHLKLLLQYASAWVSGPHTLSVSASFDRALFLCMLEHASIARAQGTWSTVSFCPPLSGLARTL